MKFVGGELSYMYMFSFSFFIKEFMLICLAREMLQKFINYFFTTIANLFIWHLKCSVVLHLLIETPLTSRKLICVPQNSMGFCLSIQSKGNDPAMDVHPEKTQTFSEDLFIISATWKHFLRGLWCSIHKREL